MNCRTTTRRAFLGSACTTVAAGLVFPLGLLAQTLEPPSFPAPTASILLLGTFHFQDAGLDSYKPQFDIDVRSPARQKQIENLIEALAGYAPTKIAVEAKADRQATLDQRFESFLAGSFELPPGELYQLGFRLAKKLAHAKVWAVDAEARYYEPWVDPSEFAQEHGQAKRLDPLLELAYERLYRWQDEQKTRETLIETLVRMSSEESLRRLHGHYLIDSFEVGDEANYPGADSRTAWYNRNLRIFANLQRLREKPGERILLIIGNGHVPILRHAVQASPEYQLVEVEQVLTRPKRR